MRDVSDKAHTVRTALAEAVFTAPAAVIARIQAGDLPKGDPIPVAKVAAIQAAKATPTIIPYCHPLPIEHVGVAFTFAETSVTVRVSVKSTYKTGVEMEALTAAMAAALTLYDMAKMLDDALGIERVVLLEKRGGKTGDYVREGYTAG